MRNDTLIVEDAMLLPLHDETGTPATAATLFHVLGGAVLVDLARHRVIDVGGPTVVARPGRPYDPLLRAAHAAVARRPRDLRVLVPEIGATLWTPVVDRLVERGRIRRRRTRALGLHPVATPPVPDARHESSLRARVQAVLDGGAPPDPHTAAVVALLSASGTLPVLHLTPARAARAVARAEALEDGHRADDPSALGPHAIAGRIAAVVAVLASSTPARPEPTDALAAAP